MKPRNHFDAVRLGVADAVDGAIRNATHCPTADFFDSVSTGVRNALPYISEDLIRDAITEGTRLAILELRGNHERP